MLHDKTYDVIIIGGGLAGLTCSKHLSSANINVLLIEKNKYPYHKVCGEYVSNEVLPYLNQLNIDVFSNGAVTIDTLKLTTQSGKIIQSKLPLGGFGISRYLLDKLLYNSIKDKIDVVFDSVTSISKEKDGNIITTQSGKYLGKIIVGAFGKRSNLDINLNRKFIAEKSPWLAIKAHYKYDIESNTVGLHNFEGGYCGISKVENDVINCCYLTTYHSFKKLGNIEDFQNKLMSKNPYLQDFFKKATPLLEKPLAISQISFSEKEAVYDDVFMIGDSAGLIHPLCGNGMAMAIHSAKIFSELFLKHFKKNDLKHELLKQEYSENWNYMFKDRLKAGRSIQKVLLNKNATKIAYGAARIFPSIVTKIIKKTHGKVWA